MSFRLAFSRLQLSIGYPSQSLVKGLRTYCDSKKFKSLLPDRNTASPFYDLTRTADNRSEKYVIRSGDSTLAEGSSSEVYARNSTMNDLDVSEDVEKMKRRKRMERNTRIGGIIVVGGTLAGLVAFCLYYGRAKRDESGNIILDEWSGTFFAPFYRISNSFKLWRDYVIEPAREQLLPDPLPAPYLQPKYTLVIEMKNILIHPEWTYKTGYRFAKRPALDYFLDVVGYPNFEVVINRFRDFILVLFVTKIFDNDIIYTSWNLTRFNPNLLGDLFCNFIQIVNLVHNCNF
uniref:Mitochondrial import inner membrane translocase subunit TIM50 n=1 Tax=Heterorhabditis bacteriophora TaxID=37862 RepID=A0A1I7XLV4_HETBA